MTMFPLYRTACIRHFAGWLSKALFILICCFSGSGLFGQSKPTLTPLDLSLGDVIPTGNEWIALHQSAPPMLPW